MGNEINDNELEKLKNLYKEVYNNNKSIIRKVIFKYVFIRLIVFLIIFIIIKISFMSIIPFSIWYKQPCIYVAISMDIILFMIILCCRTLKYKNTLKTILVKEFIEKSNSSFTYKLNLEDKELQDIFSEYKYAQFKDKNRLLLNQINKIEIEDYIEGNVNSTHIRMMKIILSRVRRSGRGEFTAINFAGNLLIIDKSINGYANISSKKPFSIEKDFLGIGFESLELQTKRKVLENTDLNSEFESEYDIVSQDRYLTDELKSFILEFRKKYNIDFDIVLSEKIYVRFYTKDMFPVSRLSKKIDERSIYQYYVLMKFIEEFVEKLNNL